MPDSVTPTPGPAKPVKPPELTNWEKAVAWTLGIVGVVLIVAVLIGFTSDGYTYVSKTIETVEATGQPKKTTETDYADTVVVFALTVGAALILAGAFFSRIRSLKLGALTVEVGQEAKDEAKDSAADAVKANEPDPQKQAALVPAAQLLAVEKLEKAAALGVKPTNALTKTLGAQAAAEVLTPAADAAG